MQKTMLMAALSATLAMAAATVQAQDPMPPKPAPPPPATPAPPAAPMSWSALDANGNGTLDAGEAARMESLAKVFPSADADANGELSQDEYKAWLAANGNGKAKPAAGG